MANTHIDHSASALYRMEVLRRERVSPSMVRVTFGGEDLAGFRFQGFDHWCRLALPVDGGAQLDRLPTSFGLGGYLRYLRMPKGTRPVIRNYTIRQVRTGDGVPELDIDFVVHSDRGVAGPWARSAAVGILRDLPRTATGHALIEVPDASDAQQGAAPPGMSVYWLVREPGRHPGETALEALQRLEFPPGAPQAFAAGESALATGARGHLVRERRVPRDRVTFVGYWKRGRA